MWFFENRSRRIGRELGADDGVLSRFSLRTREQDLDTSLTERRNVTWTALVGVAVFSCFINVLVLTGPFFMLQVYDRVLPSRSVPTLAVLLCLAVGLYAVLGLLEVIRSRLMARIAVLIDTSLSTSVLATIAEAPLKGGPDGDVLRPAQDLDQIRTFLSSAGPIALFDLPWMPILLAVCFLLHPLIGWLTAGVIILLVVLTLIADLRTRSLIGKAATAAAKRNLLGEAVYRTAESIAAMGMSGFAARKWDQAHAAYATLQRESVEIGGKFSGISKSARLMLQSCVLGIGAYLAVIGTISPGMIVAASIIVARTVVPIEQVIGNWRTMLAAGQAWQRLKARLASVPVESQKTVLPAPHRRLSVEGVFVSPPGVHNLAVRNVTFHLLAGSVMGIIGPSASGKSSLARALAGVWSAARGQIRLDGASLDQWSRAQRGRHIGYMPQTVDLFPGTIAENIARLAPERDDEAVIAAAQAAGVHEMVVAFPNGYDFEISNSGANLSAGQRQRVALARALYGNPFLVVLDEPNSNLDTDGERALAAAVANVRKRGGIVIVIAHRKSLLSLMDIVLVMEKGAAKTMGPRDLVLATLGQQQADQPSPALKKGLTIIDGERG